MDLARPDATWPRSGIRIRGRGISRGQLRAPEVFFEDETVRGNFPDCSLAPRSLVGEREKTANYVFLFADSSGAGRLGG